MAGAVIQSTQFQRLLDKRLDEVYKMPSELDRTVDSLFKKVKSDKAWYEAFNVSGLGDVREFNGALEYLTMAPGYYVRIEPAEFAAGIQIERKLLDDDLYGVVKLQANLVNSEKRKRDKIATEAFAHAFSAAFDFGTNEEGVALCSNSHTTKTPGVSTSTGFDNLITDAISKTSLSAARIVMRKFKDSIGERIEVDPDMVIMPDDLYPSFCEAVGYDALSGASSDRDPISSEGMINSQFKYYKPFVIRRLSDYDTSDWFMVDSKLMKENLIWVDRIAADLETTWDFETKAYKQSIYSRFGYGWLDWRFVIGAQVS